MPDLKKELKARLDGASRIAVLGIGSELRQDDASGVIVVTALKRAVKKIKTCAPLLILDGATAPENLTGEIKSFLPTHLIIVDTVEFRARPGTILLVDPKQIDGGVSFSTHKLPAHLLIDYFTKSIHCNIIIIGIQPKGVSFGKSVSKSVASAAREVAAAIVSAIKVSGR